jgi:predicted transposase YdaD
MFYPVLAERVRYFKESGGGTQSMCKLLEDVRKEAAEERNKEFAQALLEMGTMSVEQIAKLSKLPLEEVEILAQQQAQ